MDLYVDGNIAQMFCPEGAVRYFSRLLGVDFRPFRSAVSQEQPQAFSITIPALHDGAQNTHPPLAINEQRLDYAISQRGTIVPQRLWSPGSPTEARRYTKVPLNMPIFFIRNDCMTLGLPMLRAIGGDSTMLLGAGDAAPVGNGSTMYIRINWPGYGDWTSQIMTRDQTTTHNTITLKKFAKRVASAVARFFDKAKYLKVKDSNWRIGPGGIAKEDVILIGAVHVSQGSWQPILQLNHYVVPRRQHIPGLPYHSSQILTTYGP